MRRVLVALFAFVAVLVLASPAEAGPRATQQGTVDPIPVEISHRLKDRAAPQQPTPAQAADAVAQSATTASQCFGDDSTLTITIPSFDPANPGQQNVVFFRETVSSSGGKATLWVAWDFLATAYGRQDAITCDQLAYLQGEMDGIVETDVHYFGEYMERPAGNENIDVMIYNIVDESYFDAGFPFYIAGFFWAALNQAFDRNMIFVDSFDWANRLGPDAARPFLYEGTVAHELEHLIHHDHDADEDSWIDEGMADLAQYLNGYGHPDGHVVYYLAFHRTPLTVWGGGLEDYGASYLFQLYLLENFGTKSGGTWDNAWTRSLVDTQANSIAGVEQATGKAFNDLYDSWALANYLDRPDLDGAGGYPIGYGEIDVTPFTSPSLGAWSIERAIDDIYGAGHQGNLPIDRYYGGFVSGTVEFPVGDLPPYTALYGTYDGIQPVMDVHLPGSAASGIAPYAGTREMASGGGHLLTDRMLALNAPVGGTLTFRTWFDIEEEWDYGFVEASTDGGSGWTPLPGSITRASQNPNSSTAWANSLVSGQAMTDTAITGSSGGWVEATFALPAAADVLIRFSYYTDEAVNGTGWFIDEVSTTSGFSDGFEDGTGSWSIDAWSWTTGLFANDWMAAYVLPQYQKGQLVGIEYDYVPSAVEGANEVFNATLDTRDLKQSAATVLFANRPGDSPFAGGYLLLVEKGKAD